jgi:hypothetical protein
MEQDFDGHRSKDRAALLRRGWCAAGTVAVALVLQACGGGDAVDATGRAEQANALAAAPTALSTAATVATVDLVAPGSTSRYRIEQLEDGILKITLSVGDGVALTGDIRAFYFHMAGNNVQGLTVSGDLVSGFKRGANTVTQAGGADTKLSRPSGVVATGGFDVGVEIGTGSTAGADDVQSTVIFVSRSGGLTLADIRYAFDDVEGTAYLGLVARSVGTPGTRRRGDINAVFEPGVILPPPPPPTRVYEVGNAHLCVAGLQLVGCVGDNTYGQSPPFETSFVVVATQVAAGVRHSCALGLAIVGGSFATDVVACWGVSSPTSTAQLPQPVLGPVAQIAAGNDTTCALTMAGAVQCWAATTNASALNAYTVAGLGTVVDLAVGGSRACAVNVLGNVSCWNKDTGAPEGGTLGMFTQVDAFGGVACGATNAGSAGCWSIALATVVPSPPPVTLSDVTQVAVGNNFACAVAAGGVSCWATGLIAPVPSVLAIPAGLTDVRSIEAGGDTVCANKRASGEVVCWGAISFTFFGAVPE